MLSYSFINPIPKGIFSKTLPLLACLAMTSCNDNYKNDAMPFHEFKGVWEQPGYGRAWVFGGTSLMRYEYNSKGCIEVDAEPLVRLVPHKTHFKLSPDGKSFALTGVAAKPWQFKQVKSLPPSCEHPLKGTQAPLVQFDYFWNTFNDYYAFFQVRGLDWQQVYSQYRPRIANAANDAERQSIYQEIIQQFGDAHVALSDRKEFTVYGEAPETQRGGLTAETISSPLISQRDEKGFNQLARLTRSHIDSFLLTGSRHQAGIEQEGIAPLVWGRLQDNVGYLRVERLVDFNETSDIKDLRSALDYVERETQFIDTQLSTIKKDLAGVKGVVIDLRYNGGGFDELGLQIVSHFNKQAHSIGQVSVAGQPPQSIEVSHQVDAWSVPMVVFTSADTASAAEVMTLALQTLPNTTLMGEATHGIFSDVLDRALPNNWFAGLSNEQYTNLQGQALESKGVLPKVVISPFASSDYLFGSSTLVDRALQQLGVQSVNKVTNSELEATITEVMSHLDVPGFGLAVIKDNKVLWAKGYGLADRENQTPVTEYTPFSLASISKAVVGSYIMQEEQAGSLSLHDTVSPAVMGFSLASPHTDARAITLADLVTHTSGIHDNPSAYPCNYYLLEDGSSLLNVLMGDSSRCQPPITDQTEYLKSYLSQGGSLYSPAHFAVAPGQQREYSNVGAALAGQYIENRTGGKLTHGMQQQIFSPLGLQDTGWNQDALPHTPAQLYTHLLGTGAAVRLPSYRYSDYYSGGLWSSASDLARYLVAIAQGGEVDGVRILAASQVNKMLTAQTSVNTGALQQGVFWIRDGNFIGHDGSDPGTETLMYYNPVTQVGIVVLANTDSLLKTNDDGTLSPDQPYYRLLRALYRNALTQ